MAKSTFPTGYADEYNRWPNTTAPQTSTLRGLDPYQVADAYLRKLEDNRLARMRSEKFEAQNYDQYLFNRNREALGQDRDADVDAQRQLRGMAVSPVQSGPILTETMNPGGLFSGSRGPRVITGGLTPANQFFQDQFRERLLGVLDSMMGFATGRPGGVDYDAILKSMNADMGRHYAGERNRVAERYAGLGRSMSSTAANEALGGVGEMEGRQGLANRAEVEKLRIQGNNSYANILATLLPTILKMYGGGA